MRDKRHSMDMINGPILPKIILYSFPIMLSGIFQLLYNTADMATVGSFCGNAALAAVGSTSALVTLQINLFVGIATGARVKIAQYYGARRLKDVSEMSHTAILVAVICGVFLTIVGLFFSRTFLIWMSSPADVIDTATIYLKVYFLGMPASMIVNFGTAILGAAGETKKPTAIMMISCIINVVLNLILVYPLGVSGVALATVIGQYFSAVMIMRCLIKNDEDYKINLRELRIYGRKLKEMLIIGIPAGIQGCMFSISNVVVQATINGFDTLVVAGSSAANSLEGFVYTSVNSVSQGTLTFTGQNIGAGQKERIGRIYRDYVLATSVIGILLGAVAILTSKWGLLIFTTDSAVIVEAQRRLICIVMGYFVCGLMDVTVGVLRGLGYSIMPTFFTIFGVCGIRILGINIMSNLGLIDFSNPAAVMFVYLTYPVSWIITTIIHTITLHFVRKKMGLYIKRKGENKKCQEKVNV